LVDQPISIGVDATTWQFYKSGVLMRADCGEELDHGVLLTGYNASASVPYWIVKNSWSATWGEKGYINLQEGNTCGLCNTASFATV